MFSKVLSIKNIPRPNFVKSKIVKEKKTFTQYHQRPRVPSEKYHKKTSGSIQFNFLSGQTSGFHKTQFLNILLDSQCITGFAMPHSFLVCCISIGFQGLGRPRGRGQGQGLGRVGVRVRVQVTQYEEHPPFYEY